MYGLIGRRLGHSYSAPIHRALTNGAYDYRLIEVEPDALADFLRSQEFNSLFWNHAQTGNLAGYRIYRRAAGETSARKIGEVNLPYNTP